MLEPEPERLIGVRGGLRSVLERVAMVAPSDLPVLLLGETGTGKEVIARVIHDGSVRCDGPFWRVNCGALSPELVDSELFGHERGSFTGAIAQRKGWFEQAHRGTLFLDEVAELSPAVQVRLLRVLQEGDLVRVGGTQTIAVDVRIVAATHRDLVAMVEAREFRDDLFYRISAFPLVIPPLRERSGDIPELARYFAARAARRFELRPVAIDAHDLELLLDYPWPGNVRELASVIDRAVLLGEGRRVDIARSLHLSPRAAMSRSTHTDHAPPGAAAPRATSASSLPYAPASASSGSGATGSTSLVPGRASASWGPGAANTSSVPGHAPSSIPGHAPSSIPGHAPSSMPGHAPSSMPGHAPSSMPGHAPSSMPGHAPSSMPGHAPSSIPGHAPSSIPGHAPSSVSGPGAFAAPHAPAHAPHEHAPIEPLDDVIRRHIEHALAVCKGRIDGPFGAAQRLAINPHTLRARMRKLGINWRRHRGT
jgi:transcriptional regulator with GAF, ATPase, and Fis domain